MGEKHGRYCTTKRLYQRLQRSLSWSCFGRRRRLRSIRHYLPNAQREWSISILEAFELQTSPNETLQRADARAWIGRSLSHENVKADAGCERHSRARNIPRSNLPVSAPNLKESRWKRSRPNGAHLH